jgi:predicted ATPase/DNA-binding winged helix-turn-helix (wHTH) protein
MEHSRLEQTVHDTVGTSPSDAVIDNSPNHVVRAFAFGPFRLLPEQRLLLEGDQPVMLGARALSILVALIDRAGEVISKRELLSLVWPNTFVEEGNLRLHVAGLRRALRDGQLGSRYVVNVPGRGYSFVAPIQVQVAPTESPPPAARPAQPSSLPLALTRIVGRSAVVDGLSASLPQRRFVTVIGPGGIGKTTVAVAVAHALSPSYRDGVCFVDFASISRPQLVPTTLSAVLGLAIPSEDAIPAIVGFLRHKHLLLVLDSCEHVIEAVAAAAEEISNSAEDVHILATSREPLRTARERVFRLSPLEGPPISADLTAAQAMTFPGIQLFVERAAATMDDFALSDADAPVAADICRRLDGIALAIELAAGRVAAFGMRELQARLDDRFRLLTGGRRTALSRHQTLAATLDWSYELLPDEGRRLLRWLAVFAGDFTLDAAAALFGGDDPSRAITEIAELVAKSLVVADVSVDPVRYRLLETTKFYGIDKLRQGGELQQARRVHAEYFRNLFAGAEAACEVLPQLEWLATYASQLDNVRAALDWAGSVDGDPDIYVSLTIGAVPLWVQLSLMSECRGRVQHAFALLAGDSPAVTRARMQLYAAQAWSLMYAAGRSRDIAAAWASTKELAERLGDTGYRLRAFWGIWINLANRGDFAEALTVARQLMNLVKDSTDALDLILADRLLGSTLHYLGDQAAARHYLERMLSRYAAIGNQPRVARFQVDPRATAHYFLTRVLWLQGFADQARRLTKMNIAEGLAIGHALSFSNVLGQGACLIALFTGDLADARRYAAILLDHEKKHGLNLWQTWASAFNGLLAIKEGDVEAGLDIMRAAFERAGNANVLPRYSVLLGEYAANLGKAGSVSLGLETIDAVLTRCESSQGRWYLPEALRIKADLMALSDTPDTAEAGLLQAVALARRQDSRAWELRAATSLARLRRAQGRDAEGRSQLSEILGAFSEGFDTADLWLARDMLSSETSDHWSPRL